MPGGRRQCKQVEENKDDLERGEAGRKRGNPEGESGERCKWLVVVGEW